jgi:hypothetical protein
LRVGQKLEHLAELFQGCSLRLLHAREVTVDITWSADMGLPGVAILAWWPHDARANILGPG